MGKRVVAVVPARMASTRFPGKPLTRILALPMVEHVRRRALLASGVEDVVVATCDQEIMDAVIEAGGKAVWTSDKHERATERVAEAMELIEADVVVVVQGDEPLLLPEAVEQVAAPLVGNDSVTCVSLLSPLEGEADFQNPNIVKAVLDRGGEVIYFSRAPVPYFMKRGACPVYRETGIRAFRADFLKTYRTLPETPFERVEAVDMLRLIEHGFRILGVPVGYSTIGVDHADDVPVVERLIESDPEQRALYQRTLELREAGRRG